MLSSSLFREGNGTPLQYSCLENLMDGRVQGKERKRDYCIADANEGDLGLVRKRGKGKEGKRKRK